MRVRWVVEVNPIDEKQIAGARTQLNGIVEVLTSGMGRVVYEETFETDNTPSQADTSQAPRLRLVEALVSEEALGEDEGALPGASPIS